MSEICDSRRLGALLFPGFEVLDLFGPLEMFGNLPGAIDIVTVAQSRGPVAQRAGPVGGGGVRLRRLSAARPAADPRRLRHAHRGRQCGHDRLAARTRAPQAEVVMTVCSGTALPARAGLLDGRRATTNKMFFQEVAEQGPRVEWVREARWVEDGKFATSSGCQRRHRHGARRHRQARRPRGQR